MQARVWKVVQCPPSHSRRRRVSNAEAVKRYRRKHPDRVAATQKAYWDKRPMRRVFYACKKRAKRDGREFTIDLDYLESITPEYCPALGIKLERGVGKLHDASPSVDRIDNDKGYVPGNVQVLSYKANRMKSNATLEELELLVKWLQESKVHL